MGTKTIKPRSNNDGQIGHPDYYWNKGYFNDLHANNLYTSVTGLTANTLKITDASISFEGTGVDDFETILAVTNPTADRVIAFPDATGTVALTSDIPSATTVGWHGSATRIKILPRDFVADDTGRPLMIDDTDASSSEFFLETFSTTPAYATVVIPTGYKATHVRIYGDGTPAITVLEGVINDKTFTSKGTGNVGTEINITDVTSSTTNYLFITVAQGASDEIYGGYVTIAAV